ncbi:uncharacterized protein LOC136058371 [Cyrtonyx montezumae]|uniref:uncharacterized protein LOC136058371 n=1 Tax=Cyrtonyx montezumae TaxID=9017 RepID=UPI0032DA2CE4
MDNQAFEMHTESTSRSLKGREWLQKEDTRGGARSLLKLFVVCLLAGLITTAISVLTLSLIYTNTATVLKEIPIQDSTVPSQLPLDIKFQFLHHMSKSKAHVYPGGEIRWAGSMPDSNQYNEAIEFGESLRKHHSKMSFATLRIRARGLRVPHWHFNANEHGYVQQGTAWIGVIDTDTTGVTTYNVTAGQVVFFPRNTVHWIKNVGEEDCVFLLFFGTHDELKTLDVDDAFFSTPEDIVARALKPRGGLSFIRTFQKAAEDQAVNLPPNLGELVHSADYAQSADDHVWRYFYDLGGSMEHPFPGGGFQWARYRANESVLSETERIYSRSIHKHEDALTLATLRIFSNELGQPHFHFNANELGYVISGCGRAGLITQSGRAIHFNVAIGDVVFFPVGTQHYLKSVCDEDLLLLLAYSTGNQLETLRMNEYFVATADHILAQLFQKDQDEFQHFS